MYNLVYNLSYIILAKEVTILDKVFSFNLARFLQDYRYKKGLTLRELSKIFDMSPTYLCKLEKCINMSTGKPITPTIETLKKIANGMNVTMQYILDSCGNLENTPYHDKSFNNNIIKTASIKLDMDIVKIHLQAILADFRNKAPVNINGKLITKDDINLSEFILNSCIDTYNA